MQYQVFTWLDCHFLLLVVSVVNNYFGGSNPISSKSIVYILVLVTGVFDETWLLGDLIDFQIEG
tara:strand:+ start:282 stop:473 length:192 start_codon:yes stop_codon:yes gene_type:complete